jgi:hypothetical protein
LVRRVFVEILMPLEIIVGAAVGAAAASQTGRRMFRRGLVYGIAGALTAYDRVAAMTHGVVRGVRAGVSTLAEEAADTAKTAKSESSAKSAGTPPPSPAAAAPSS